MNRRQGLPAPLVLALVLALLLVLAPEALAAPPAGMVTRTSGNVQVQPAGGGKPRRADLLQALQAGDRLLVPARGSASVVVYADGHRETVPAGSFRMTARGLEGRGVQRSEASRALASLQTGSAVGGARGATTTRTARLMPPFVEVHLDPPSRVNRARPTLGLPADSGPVAPCTVAILSDQGQVVESRVLSGEPTWKPEKPLAPGTYQVVLLEEGGGALSRRPLVVLPGNPELEARLAGLEGTLEDRDPSPWVLASVLLEREGLVEAALEASWQAQVRQASPAMLRWSAKLARRLGRFTEADAWERLADALAPPAR